MLTAYQSEVEQMTWSGVRFHEIEEFINSAPGLTDEERSALWLLAWAEQDRPFQRLLAKEYLALVSG